MAENKKTSLIPIKQEKNTATIEKTTDQQNYDPQTSKQKSDGPNSKVIGSNSSISNNIHKEYQEENQNPVLEAHNSNNGLGNKNSLEHKLSSNKNLQEQNSGSKGVEKVASRQMSDEPTNKARDDHKRNTQKTNDVNFHMAIGPEIFVSLKKGSISQQYDIGKTLGEG